MIGLIVTAVQKLIPVVAPLIIDDVTKRTAKAIVKTEAKLGALSLTKKSKDQIIQAAVDRAKEKPWWLTIKFRLALIAIIVPILNKAFELHLEEGAVIGLIEAFIDVSNGFPILK